MDMIRGKKIRLTPQVKIENRYKLEVPPMNVKMFDQTPGTEVAAFGIFAQRSGLEKKNQIGWWLVIVVFASRKKGQL
jgi:hypothetical protein